MSPFDSIPNRIILHCSATDDSPAKNTDAIRAYHKSLGWDDIGYHWLIEDVGGKALLIPGRSFRYQGAHCRAAGRNRDSIGVCIIGDFDKTPPAPTLFYKAARYIALLCRVYDIHPSMVSGHREWEPKKTCPGKWFDMVAFRESVGVHLEAINALGIGPEV